MINLYLGEINSLLLWCFYQLFGLSFWRHPFTAEDPLMSKWCNAKSLQICSHDEIYIYILMAWEHFQQMFIFGFHFLLIAVNVFSGFKSMSGKEVALVPIFF